MTDIEPAGPDPATIIEHIRTTFPRADILAIPGATFCSLDPERHFPNFATLVENDDNDQASDLERPGIFRLNIGVGRATFERLVGDQVDPDFRVLDRLLPHPVYARQGWLCILNPSHATFREVVVPLLAEAHDRLAAQRARHGLDRA